MYRVSVIKGDGIGPYIVDRTVSLLDWMGENLGFSFDFREAPAGDSVQQKYGTALPADSVKIITGSDACLKGPVGETARDVIVYLRQKLELYANIRPFKNLPGVPSKWSGVDFVIVRENTEDLYKSVEDVGEDHAVALLVVTRKASERIAKTGFEMAALRRKKLTVVHKANVVIAYRLFRNVCFEVGKKFSDVAVHEMYVDNAAYQMVLNPQIFDVVLTPNMFGDILSDLAAGIVGTIGVAGSANVGESFGLFEPVHGSAPTLKPENANPTGMLMAAKMMLEWLGAKKNDSRLGKAAQLLEQSVFDVLRDGKVLTADLGGRASCDEFVEEVKKKAFARLR
ncbi:MAG: isocitrate/isopropylmalate dehydrogenase family protein [Candidatus Caldarchaeum sp.]|nr:isocitrate/isopropylmalate dehydrogenase family protein [Candidatus Caldarchaeum sp.]